MKKLTKTMKKVGIALVALMAVAMFAGCDNPSGGEPEQLGDGTLNEEFILSDWTDFTQRYSSSDGTEGLGTAIDAWNNTLVQENEYFIGKNKNLRIVHHYAGHDKTSTKSNEASEYYDGKVAGGIEIKADSISIETSNGKPLVGHYVLLVYYDKTGTGRIEWIEGNGNVKTDKSEDEYAWIEYNLSSNEATPLYIGSTDTIKITKIEVIEQPY